MENYDNIVLKKSERIILFAMRFIKKMPGKRIKTARVLLKYGVIRQNYKGQDKLGCFIPDDTYSLTDQYVRYIIYNRKQRIHRFLTPIVLSLITTILTNLLKELWLPELLRWVQGLS